jgi:hypothetical protein
MSVTDIVPAKYSMTQGNMTDRVKFLKSLREQKDNLVSMPVSAGRTFECGAKVVVENIKKTKGAKQMIVTANNESSSAIPFSTTLTGIIGENVEEKSKQYT